MRLLLVGLLGAFMLTFTPVVPDAQGQTRTGAQNQRPAVAATARPAATRPAAARPATRTANRPVAARPATRTASRPAARPASSQRRASGQRTAQRPGAAVPYSARSAAARPAANGRRAVAQRCTTRNGRRVCTRTANASFRWAGDLPPAAMSQRSCPEGTMATNAIGHSDITRCVPL